MPTKFVQNIAHRMGVSVEHAEKVWHDAKQAVKKGKRQGSWYWGKVVNTFKRMMGIKEHISFTEFKELLESVEQLEEGNEVTIGKLLRASPLMSSIPVGFGGYYLKLKKKTAIHVRFSVHRFIGSTPGSLELTVTLRTFPTGRRFLAQMSGPNFGSLGWEERSQWVEPDSGVNPLTVEFLRDFAKRVLSLATKAGYLEEDKKEGGVKKSYVAGLNADEKKEMKREIGRFSKMDHKDKDAYPEDWAADQKYKARLKKKGKKLPTSRHTSEYHRRYGK